MMITKLQPLHIILLKTSAYVKSYDEETKWIHLTDNDDSLEKSNTI